MDGAGGRIAVLVALLGGECGLCLSVYYTWVDRSIEQEGGSGHVCMCVTYTPMVQSGWDGTGGTLDPIRRFLSIISPSSIASHTHTHTRGQSQSVRAWRPLASRAASQVGRGLVCV